jgi:hypothetical protein
VWAFLRCHELLRLDDGDTLSKTYVVHSDKLPLVLKHHNLILRVAANFRIFPIINCYFDRSRTIVSGYVKNSTSRYEFSATWSLLANPSGIVNIRI